VNQPLYETVKNYVLDHIRDGSWIPGDRVPSENELVTSLSVSRMTANRALKELTQEGLLVREHGRGTFVAARRMRSHPLEIRSIKEDITARGDAYGVRVIAAEMVAATADVALDMAVDVGAELIYLRLVHFADGVAQQLEDRYVRASLAPELLSLDFNEISPTSFLLNKVPLHSAEHTVRAALPCAVDAKDLAMRSSDPVMIINRKTTSEGQVASVVTFVHPADQFELSGTFAKE